MKYLSVTQTAEKLGHSRSYIISLCNAGRLGAVKIGNAWAIPAPVTVKPSERGRGRPAKEVTCAS